MRFDLRKNKLTSLYDEQGRNSSIPSIDEKLRPILDLSEISYYNQGQMIFSEGKIARGLYYIHFGKIKVYKQGSDGKELILSLCKGGNFLGHRGLFSDNGRTTVSTKVMENAALSFLPKESFMGIIRRDCNVLLYFSQLMARESENMENKVVGMAYKPVRGRLAEVLLKLGHFYKIPSEKAGLRMKHSIDISRNDLASMVGTAKETVIRFLSELRSEGVIEIQGKSIVLLKPKELVRIDRMYC